MTGFARPSFENQVVTEEEGARVSMLWHADQLLGNDREISSHSTSVAR
jgi:hypothetical protein